MQFVEKKQNAKSILVNNIEFILVSMNFFLYNDIKVMLMAKKNKTVYKIKWKNLFLIVLLGFTVLFLILAGTKILKDYLGTKEMIDKVKEELEVKNIVDDELTKTIKPDSTLSKFDAYWNYVKLGLIEVDMAKLKKINTDCIGYIELKGTSFSYPIVKGENSFYKNHTLDKSENSFGWIYMDEQADEDELGTNTIIYGNKNYFGVLSSDLKDVLKDEWKNDDNNYIIKLYTRTQSTIWQIVSVYETKDKDHLQTTFEDESDLENYIDSMLKSTQIKFKGYAKTNDKFLTLTTNSKGTNLVIQAKLIKIRDENNDKK